MVELDGGVEDEEVLALDAAGVRAVRFNLHRGGTLDEALARRVHEVAGWHVEVYAGGRVLAALEDRLRTVPRLVVDHLGLDAEALPVLRRLGCMVKATGFGRSTSTWRRRCGRSTPTGSCSGPTCPERARGGRSGRPTSSSWPGSRRRPWRTTRGVVSTSGMSYDIHLDDKYGQMNLVDIPAELAAHEPWFNQTLTTVNDAVVRLGIIEGDFHWHKHDGEDEFFLVLEGTLLLDFEDRETVTSTPTRATRCPAASFTAPARPERTAIIMVERAGVDPTGIGCFALRSRKPHPRPAGDVTFPRSSRR